jgi:hypothetical protein
MVRWRVVLGENRYMRLVGAHPAFSPSDLHGGVACPRLTMLELGVAHHHLQKPFRQRPHADLIRRKGDEHEARFLADS